MMNNHYTQHTLLSQNFKSSQIYFIKTEQDVGLAKHTETKSGQQHQNTHHTTPSHHPYFAPSAVHLRNPVGTMGCDTCLQVDVILSTICSGVHTDLGGLHGCLLQWMNTDYCPAIRCKVYRRTATISGTKKNASLITKLSSPSMGLLSDIPSQVYARYNTQERVLLHQRAEPYNICELLSINPCSRAVHVAR